ncbi:MAG: hypothetical protein ABEJ58_04330 [Halodesulfurarchaeum sp.]
MGDSEQEVHPSRSETAESTAESAGRIERLLEWIPRWVVTLGSGFLFTATLVSLAATAFGLYLLFTRNFTGAFAAYRQFAPNLWIVEVHFVLATLFLGAGTYFARNRTRWGLVLLFSLLGSFLVITIPFTFPAFVLLALGKRHFTLNTPASMIEGSQSE